MSFLLDTNALLWWLSADRALSEVAKTTISDAAQPIHVSSISVYEIALKHRIGKLTLTGRDVADLPSAIEEARFAPLAPTYPAALLAGMFPLEHKDPWDRLLAAQAIVSDLTILSPDQAFDRLGAKRLW